MGLGCSSTRILCVEFSWLTASQISSLHWLLSSCCLQSPHLGCCDVKLTACQYTTTLILHGNLTQDCMQPAAQAHTRLVDTAATCILHAGLLQKKSQEGTQTTMEATLMAQQTPAQREQVPLTIC